jgi:hypothetical protein
MNNEQFYAHYNQWEDYLNGMYCSTSENDNDQINKAKLVLSNPDLFKEILIRLIKKWPISSRVNLTNKSINRRAWLGAAACCFEYGVTEINTRQAWSELNDIQRFNANTIAEIIINHYEEENTRLHKDLGKQMLF